MKFKKLYKILLGIFLVGTLVFIFFSLKGKSNVNYKVESLPDGEGLVVSSYNKNNEKTMELKCKESNQAPVGDRTFLKFIDGLIFKKGTRNKDIKLVGEHGYVENNSNNFFLEKNARITSESFSITGESFFLKDQADITSSPNVTYKTETLKGIALNGMQYFIDLNSIRFNNTSGTYEREKKTFTFQTSVLWFLDKEQMIVMEKDTLIRDINSYLRSDWLTLKFTPDMKHMMESTSQRNSYLYVDDREKNETKEIKGEIIKSTYDTDGHMIQLMSMQNVDVLLKNKTNHTSVVSQFVEMNYDGPIGIPRDLRIPSRGSIENTGKTKFRVVADSIYVKYNNKGELRSCEGIGNVEFIVEKYSGISKKLNYDIEKNLIALNGENSELINNKNTFRSVAFAVDSKNKVLSTNGFTRSIIELDGDNVLFNRDPVLINSQKFTLLEKENKSIYEKEISLNQGGTSLKANNLEIGKDNTIISTGTVSLSFKDRRNGKDISVKGDKMVFNSREKRIDITGNAIIKSDENILRAAAISLWFNDKNEVDYISGEKNINFNKGDLTGSSDKVTWQFKEETMVFTGSPYIVKQGKGGNSGRTMGKELKIDLKTDKISILSDDSSRTETIFDNK